MKSKYKWLLMVLAGFAVLIGLWKAMPVAEWIEQLCDHVDRLGVWGPVVFFVVYAALKLIGVPNTPFNIAAGLIFSLATGFVVALAASFTGSMLCFLFTRWYASDWARKRIEKFEHGETLIETVNEGGFQVMLLARLNPLFPGSIKDYGFGTSSVSTRSYAAATLLGQIPIVFMYVYLGWAGLASLSGSEGGGDGWSGAKLALLVGGLILSVALVVVMMFYASKVMNEKMKTGGKSDRPLVSNVPIDAGRTLVIWNPNSGSVEKAVEIRKQIEAEREITLYETSSDAEVADAVKTAQAEGYQSIIAAGGDGTVNSTVNAMMKQQVDATFGILPIGTANDFAYTLAIPDDYDEAYALLREPNLIQLDLVEFETENKRAYFANVAAGGNSDRVTECLTDELKRNWGPLCYLRGAVGVLADLDTFQTQVQFDDEEPFKIDLWNVLIANGRTNAGRLEVAPDAKPDDGMLDVILIKDGTLIDLATLTVQFWTAAYAESDQVLYRKASTFSVRSDPLLHFSIDGESISEQPVTFRIKPASLKAIVGRNYGHESA